MSMLTKGIAIAIAATLSAQWAVPAMAESAGPNTAVRSLATALHSGDLVRLRSGGPMMTVESVQGDQVNCVWWSVGDGEYRADSFSIAMIQGPVRAPSN